MLRLPPEQREEKEINFDQTQEQILQKLKKHCVGMVLFIESPICTGSSLSACFDLRTTQSGRAVSCRTT